MPRARTYASVSSKKKSKGIPFKIKSKTVSRTRHQGKKGRSSPSSASILILTWFLKGVLKFKRYNYKAYSIDSTFRLPFLWFLPVPHYLFDCRDVNWRVSASGYLRDRIRFRSEINIYVLFAHWSYLYCLLLGGFLFHYGWMKFLLRNYYT